MTVALGNNAALISAIQSGNIVAVCMHFAWAMARLPSLRHVSWQTAYLAPSNSSTPANMRIASLLVALDVRLFLL